MNLIKVITGIRRSGKSVILQSIIQELKNRTDNIIFLNFERLSDLDKAGTCKDLVRYIGENRKEGKCYVFLDEVQEIVDWQVAIKDLRLSDTSIFITGSNSKLLSQEFLTLLSGRFVSFRIRPFVYKEIVAYGKELGKDTSVMDYLVWGGFPGRFVANGPIPTVGYLTDLESTIVVNDLIKRYRIRKEVLFKKIVSYVLRCNARIFSARSVYRSLKNESATCSLNTVIKYVDYLKQAYVIDEIPRYSTKVKRELVDSGKLYGADVCFTSLHVSDGRYDLDHNMENVVYNELLYMDYTVKVYDNRGREIDFLATKQGRTYFIQVAFSVVDAQSYTREMSAFSGLDDFHQKILITNDELDYTTSTVKHIKLKDFLMMEDL